MKKIIPLVIIISLLLVFGSACNRQISKQRKKSQEEGQIPRLSLLPDTGVASELLGEPCLFREVGPIKDGPTTSYPEYFI